MPVYAFKAVSKENKVIEGTATGNSPQEIVDSLKREGLRPLTIKTEVTKNKSKLTLPDTEVISLCRYLGSMINSGLPLSEGVAVLREETKNKTTRHILNEMSYSLERGKKLSETFAYYENIFDTFFITLVKAGEASGTLGKTFTYLERQLKASKKLKASVKSAMTYPTIVLSALVIVGLMLLLFILPNIGQVFLKMKITLPRFTELMFTAATTYAPFRWYILGGLAVFGIFAFLFFQTTEGKRLLLNVFIKIPLVRRFVQKIDIARFCRTFGTLVSSAVPITEALHIAVDTMSSPKYIEGGKKIIEDVGKGVTIAQSIKKHKVFPSLITQMIAAGETSGTLDRTLADLAEFYEEEVAVAVKNSTKLIEPALMIFVGVGVGAMILSIIAPLYSVVGNLQGV